MSFVASLSRSQLDFLPSALSDQLLERYGAAIEAINTCMNEGSAPEHKTANFISTINDRVAKDVEMVAHNIHGFCAADVFVSLGMTRMAYLPKEQKPTVELIYRVMLLGALENYAKNYPRYRDEARKQVPAYEAGIAEAYTRLNGGDAKEGVDFAASARAMIEAELSQGQAR